MAEPPHDGDHRRDGDGGHRGARDGASPEIEVHPHEPSPYVEAVADEPASSAAEQPAAAQETPIRALRSRRSPSTPPPVRRHWRSTSPPNPRRQPLRFMWQMDADGRFSLGSDEFTRLIGAHTAAGFGRPWQRHRRDLRARSRRPRRQGDRDARHLERHHPELAGRRRRPLAGRIVGIADLRSRRKFDRLSRLRRLPRSRRPDAA